MARPSKITISNFPFDVDFFNSKIMVCIAGDFGVKGEIVTVQLLCAVYKEGYFMKWSMYQRALLVRNLPGVSSELLDQILARLLKWGFFDEDLFRSANVLTSVEIQRNYFNAIKRRTGINRNSFPFLLLDPEHPNNVSAYKNGVSVDNNSVIAYKNEENVSDNDIYVIRNGTSCNKNGVSVDNNNKENVTENEFLYTETPISVYKNSNKYNKNSDSVDKNLDSGVKNPLERHFLAQDEFLHTKTGVSVYKNSDSCKQKQKGSKNDNSDSVDKNGVSVNNNSVIAYKNGEKDNNNSNSDSNNPNNIIYNSIYNHHHSQHHLHNKEGEQKNEFGEQKGKKELTSLENRLQELLNEKIWIDAVCMQQHIDSKQLPALLEDFKIHCLAFGKANHYDETDLKTHFSCWLMKQKNSIPQNITNTTANGSTEIRTKSKSKRRGTEANSKKEKDYFSSF